MEIGWIEFLPQKVPCYLVVACYFGKYKTLCEFCTGKKKEDVEKFINEGVYKVERLKEEGFITNILYDDEV